MSATAVKAKGARAVRSVPGLEPPEVYELALDELTGIAGRACGCVELKDTKSGSWIRVRECRTHDRKSPDLPGVRLRAVPGPRVAAGGDLEGPSREARIAVE